MSGIGNRKTFIRVRFAEDHPGLPRGRTPFAGSVPEVAADCMTYLADVVSVCVMY